MESPPNSGNAGFQPTLPARGATRQMPDNQGLYTISTHAPRTGSDRYANSTKVQAMGFQPTLPARGATDIHADISWACAISTHAPRTGSDARNKRFNCSVPYFNPRSPHGERLTRGLPPIIFEGISTHAPRTGSDRQRVTPPNAKGISTHAPRTGSDDLLGISFRLFGNFNPRSPHGERRQFRQSCRWWTYFNPRSPHGERPMQQLRQGDAERFQPTLPARGATRAFCCIVGRSWHFNPRSPHGERPRKVTILSTRIIGFAQKVYHKTVLLRISLAENAVILPEKPRNPVRTSLQKAGGLRFARAIRAAHPYSISSPSGA